MTLSVLALLLGTCNVILAGGSHRYGTAIAIAIAVFVLALATLGSVSKTARKESRMPRLAAAMRHAGILLALVAVAIRFFSLF